MHRTLLGLFALLLCGGCYDSSFGERPATEPPEPVTTTLAELRALYAGTTFLITGEVVVSGRVTTSDRSRNFYRTFCIEQQGAALEIMAGVDHLHNDYPPGCLVTLRLKGFALGESYGTLQLGRIPQPGSGFAVDYLASDAALDRAISRTDTELQLPEPTLLTLSTLSPAMCGTLVRIEELHYTPEELSEATWAGYKRFTDDRGDEIYTYVRAYADFAGQEVPAGRCSLTGILQYSPTGSGRYLLKLCDADDCVR